MEVVRVPVSKATGSQFGKNLRELRLQQKPRLSQRALALKVKVSYPHISDLETNPAANPTLDLVRRLAGALGCEPAALLAGVPKIV